MKDIKEITEALEQGVSEVFVSERFQNLLDTMSKFYRYSANNCMLIAMQKPDATMVASYKKWQSDFGRQVRKGEVAIRILAPIKHKVAPKPGEDEDDERFWLSFKPVPVFDISQTDGEPLPDIVAELDDKVSGYDALVEKLISIATVPVRWEDISTGANGYFSHKGFIALRNGMSELQTVKTLIHEIAHSILHCKGGTEEKADCNEREVQAESVAYVVGGSVLIRAITHSDISPGGARNAIPRHFETALKPFGRRRLKSSGDWTQSKFKKGRYYGKD